VPTELPLPGLAREGLIPEIGAANRALAHYHGGVRAIPRPEILRAPLTTQEAELCSRIKGTRATYGGPRQPAAGFGSPGEAPME
jgi:hypothetical protein